MVTRLDASAAWKSATAMVAANRDMLMAIAGVFFLLPGLIGAVFVPAPVIAASMSDAQKMDAMQAYFASSLPVLLLLSLVPMAGVLTMLVVMLDGSRPTVSEAIRRSLGALPSYFAAQLLIGLGILLALAFVVAALALLLPDRLAASIALAVALYPVMRTALVGPVMAGRGDRNPVAAIRESLRLTKSNTGRMLAFIGLAGFVFLVVYGLVMMFVGVVLVLTTDGEAQRLLGEAISGVLQAVAYTYFVAMLAAVYGQLAAPPQQQVNSAFE